MKIHQAGLQKPVLALSKRVVNLFKNPDYETLPTSSAVTSAANLCACR